MRKCVRAIQLMSCTAVETPYDASMPYTQLGRWFVLSGLVTLTAGAALMAQPPLTRTPEAAPGYTNVIVSRPVKATQEGTWTVKAAQAGEWTMKIAEGATPSFIRAQRSYVLFWDGGTTGPAYLVTETRDDGWIRASVNENGRRRERWINTRQLAAVEEIP